MPWFVSLPRHFSGMGVEGRRFEAKHTPYRDHDTLMRICWGAIAARTPARTDWVDGNDISVAPR